MKKGNMKTHARMADYAGRPNLYVIGSVTNLDGFIQILDSKAFNSRVRDSVVVIDTSFNLEATLWLMAEVDAWKEIDIPATVTDWAGLQAFIADELSQQKVSLKAVTPFLLRGVAASADWHVVHWDTTDHDITYRKTIESGLQGKLQNEPIEGIGFFSKRPYEILVHKSQEMHIHFVNEARTLAGHLDGITLDGRMKLLLPAAMYRTS